MSIVLAAFGVVALVQGLVDIDRAARRGPRARSVRGTALAPIGMLLVAAALARAVAPGFF